jgi:hypothetical protein
MLLCSSIIVLLYLLIYRILMKNCILPMITLFNINFSSSMHYDIVATYDNTMVSVIVVNEYMPWDGLSWGRTYTGGSGGGKAR